MSNKIQLFVGFDGTGNHKDNDFKKPLLKAIFTSSSALNKKPIFSLTNVCSCNFFPIRLDFKENIVFTNSFYEKRKVA